MLLTMKLYMLYIFQLSVVSNGGHLILATTENIPEASACEKNSLISRKDFKALNLCSEAKLIRGMNKWFSKS